MPREKPKSPMDTGTGEKGTPLARTLARHPLESMTDIRSEMARVYRAICNRNVEPKVGQGLVYVLGQIGRVTEGADLEKRISELEQRHKGGKP